MTDVGGHVSHNFLIDTGAQISLIPYDERLAKFATGKSIMFSGVTGAQSKVIQLLPIIEPILGLDNLLRTAKAEQLLFQDHPLWAKDALDCGLIKGCKPVVVEGELPPPMKQYPIKPEAEKSAAEDLPILLERGIVISGPARCNSPLYPVKKGLKWRITVDFRGINKHAVKITPVVADLAYLMASIPSDSEWYSVLDMKNRFWSVPVAEESRHWFGFCCQGEQFKWARVPMGFTNSPTWYHSALKQSLKGWTFEGSVLVQCVDDLLLASKDEETHMRDLTTLVDYLAEQGHKASYEKAQLAKQEVTYLRLRFLRA
uniref:ribonuclease H n=1 Tax=Salmo trutta TaxID=8032 RepID=A0A674F7R7_SALTR